MAGNPQSDVFLLGGNGFIGTALSDRLRGEGRLVTVLDPMPPRDPSHREYWIPGKLEDIQLCDKVLRPGMTVVHLACSSLPEPSNRDPHGDLSSNLLPTVLWLGACAEAGVSKVIFMSSGGLSTGFPEQLQSGKITPLTRSAPTVSGNLPWRSISLSMAICAVFRRLCSVPRMFTGRVKTRSGSRGQSTCSWGRLRERRRYPCGETGRSFVITSTSPISST